MDPDFWDTLSFLYTSWLFYGPVSFLLHPRLRGNDPNQIFSPFFFPLLFSVLGCLSRLSSLISHLSSTIRKILIAGCIFFPLLS